MFQTDLQWCVWVSQAGFGHSLKMCKREQAWLACVPVLLWHFLEMPGSCTERILEDWWELQGTCGYASAASATGAWDCLLTSLPVLRRLFLGKDGMCALYWSGWRALSTYWETWIALGQNSAHLVVYIVGIPGRAESLSCPLSEHLFLCMKSSFACLFFSSIWNHFYLNRILWSIRSVNDSKDFVRSSWVFCSAGKSLWVEALECTLVLGRTVRGCGTWAELCLSSLRQNDSKGITVERFFH